MSERSWQDLIEHLSTLPEPRHSIGPWNGKYLAPYSYQSDRVTLEPIAPRITDLDYDAYMSSIEHIQRSYGTGHFPTSEITLDEASLDTHECWNHFGRGSAFLYAALTPSREEELGCVYLQPTADPYETSLELWVVEREVATDLDRYLLETALSWIRSDWDFRSVLHLVPTPYTRGLDNAKAAGLESVDRADQSATFACFLWTRSVELAT